ncbi:MAG: Tn7 transposase TnsA N-terminal domain-containing protein [Rhodospirillaceae bacterium]
MPVRAIPISHRSVTGRLASRPGQPTIAYESSLERDFALLQLFDMTVESVEEQPVRIDYVAAGGRSARYIPDFLVFHKGNRPIPRLVEEKYRAELTKKADQYAARFEAARLYAAGRGWTFELATEETMRRRF